MTKLKIYFSIFIAETEQLVRETTNEHENWKNAVS